MNVVHCKVCGAIFREEDLVFDEALVLVAPERAESCPNCMEWEGLQDLDSKCSFRNYELIDLYRLFQEVPECESGCIEESFMDFPAGTPVAEIEAWFDERFDGGIEELKKITG